MTDGILILPLSDLTPVVGASYAAGASIDVGGLGPIPSLLRSASFGKWTGNSSSNASVQIFKGKGKRLQVLLRAMMTAITLTVMRSSSHV